MDFGDCHKGKVLVWTVVWVFLITVSLEIFFRSGVLWRLTFLEPYFLNVDERRHHNAFLIEQIKSREKSTYEEYFVFLGGSATGVESIMADEEVAKSLSDRAGKKIGFSSIVASYGTITDFEKIIHSLAEADVTFVIGVSPLLFNQTLKRSYEFYHKKLKRQMLKYYYLPAPIDTLSILKNLGADISLSQYILLKSNMTVVGDVIKKSCIKWIAGQDPKGKFRRHNISPKARIVVKDQAIKKSRRKYRSKKTEALYLKRSTAHFIILEKLLNFCKSRQIDVLLVEPPHPDAVFPAMQRGFRKYFEDIEDVSQKYQVSYRGFQENGPWAQDYFWDVKHMMPSGRKKFTPMLVAYLTDFTITKKAQTQERGE